MSALIELNDTELEGVSGGRTHISIHDIGNFNVSPNIVAPVNVALWDSSAGNMNTYTVGGPVTQTN
jgi:hypothetical protein